MITLTQIQVHPSVGLKETLFQISQLENKALNNPIFVKWVHQNFGSECIPCIPGKIWNYMKNYFKYERDDPHDELIIAPYLMPDLRYGDCDDFSLFAKTCLDILGGWFAHYLLLGKERGVFTHIVVFAHRGKSGADYFDPVVIDGSNKTFNVIPSKYNYCLML